MSEQKLNKCPFCSQGRVQMLVDQEEWEMARVACRAHRCGALGPYVELAHYATVADAKAEAARLWNAA